MDIVRHEELMSGALMQLVLGPAAGLPADPVNGFVVNQIMTLDLTEECDLQDAGHRADAVTPEYLILDVASDWRNWTLEFNYANGPRRYIPLRVLSYLSPPQTIPGDKIKLACSYAYFDNLGYIPTLSLRFTVTVDDTKVIGVRVRTDDGVTCPCTLVIKATYYDRAQRHETIARRASPDWTPGFLSSRVRNVDAIHIKSNVLNHVVGDFPIVGFIVHGPMHGLSRFRISLDGRIRIDLTAALMHTVCQQLDENSFYISMNFDGDLRQEATANAFNAGRVDNFTLLIEATEANLDFVVYAIQTNNHRIYQGTIVPEYGHIGFSIRGDAPRLTKTWIRRDLDFEVTENCPISYEPIDITEGVCRCGTCLHIFGFSNFRRWIAVRDTCPICRHAVAQYIYYMPREASSQSE